jgi:hypothetical protein
MEQVRQRNLTESEPFVAYAYLSVYICIHRFLNVTGVFQYPAAILLYPSSVFLTLLSAIPYWIPFMYKQPGTFP